MRRKTPPRHPKDRRRRGRAVLSAPLGALAVAAVMAFTQVPHTLQRELHQEFGCIIENVSREAAGECFDCKVAVANVTLLRRDDSRWPNTICGVVHQPRQFSWTLNRRRPPLSARQRRAARLAVMAALAGWQPCDGARWYHRDDVKPIWRHALTPECRLGRHIFYVEP